MNIEISKDDLSDGGVEALLQQHMEEMHKYSPPESVHALDTDALRAPGLTFWSARVEGEVVACGALMEIAPLEGEVKSMKTKTAFLRKGLAAALLTEIITEAQNLNFTKISLETGSDPAFDPAAAMYEKFGFVECGPFGDYTYDPYSRFFTKAL